MGRIKIIEFGLTILSLGWAVTLLSPNNVFNNPAYAPMSEIAPEWLWGVLTLILGLIHLIGLLTKCKHVKQIGLLLATMLWIFVSTMFFLAGGNTGVVGYLSFSIMSALLYYKVTNYEH